MSTTWMKVTYCDGVSEGVNKKKKSMKNIGIGRGEGIWHRAQRLTHMEREQEFLPKPTGKLTVHVQSNPLG